MKGQIESEKKRRKEKGIESATYVVYAVSYTHLTLPTTPYV